jgi:hypothetical protein
MVAYISKRIKKRRKERRLLLRILHKESMEMENENDRNMDNTIDYWNFNKYKISSQNNQNNYLNGQYNFYNNQNNYCYNN